MCLVVSDIGIRRVLILVIVSVSMLRFDMASMVVLA